MTNKEKEKLWLSIVKENSKKIGFKFNSYFAYNVIDKFFYTAWFDVYSNKDVISLRLQSKPFVLDDLFWQIIGEETNSKKPISFRFNAAFKVFPITLFSKEYTILSRDTPELEIKNIFNELIESINDNVEENHLNEDKVLKFYEAIKSDDSHAVGIITSLIWMNEKNLAIEKIDDFKSRNIRSGYTFGDEDFYDLALKYCKKNTTHSTLPKAGQSWLKKLFRYD